MFLVVGYATYRERGRGRNRESEIEREGDPPSTIILYLVRRSCFSLFLSERPVSFIFFLFIDHAVLLLV